MDENGEYWSASFTDNGRKVLDLGTGAEPMAG